MVQIATLRENRLHINSKCNNEFPLLFTCTFYLHSVWFIYITACNVYQKWSSTNKHYHFLNIHNPYISLGYLSGYWMKWEAKWNYSSRLMASKKLKFFLVFFLFISCFDEILFIIRLRSIMGAGLMWVSYFWAPFQLTEKMKWNQNKLFH